MALWKAIFNILTAFVLLFLIVSIFVVIPYLNGKLKASEENNYLMCRLTNQAINTTNSCTNLLQRKFNLSFDKITNFGCEIFKEG